MIRANIRFMYSGCRQQSDPCCNNIAGIQVYGDINDVDS